MVAAPVTLASDTAPGGLRPFNVRRDTAQVVELLRIAFGPTLDSEGRRILDSNISVSQQAWFNLYGGNRNRYAPGFVWEEKGRIVGNASLLTTSVSGRFLVANVAVHPHHRRRGIARELMHAVLDAVAGYGGHVVLLQVEHNNAAATQLYATLGFQEMGDVTTWKARYAHLRELPLPVTGRGPDRIGTHLLRPIQSREWKRAYELDRRASIPDLDWPQPINRDFYRSGFWRSVVDFFNARHQEVWVIADEQDQMLCGVAQIRSEWGRPHQLRLRVIPEFAGSLERPLLAKLLRRLKYLASRNVWMEHPAHDMVTSALLREANFVANRTLKVMRYDLS